ncbi:MAG TPA: phage portal protein [Sedimentisphaerales bacterium]|nr:phage portal protein [Sedimentisphaerales bacterium]
MNKALQDSFLFSSMAGKAIALNQLDVVFPELFGKDAQKTVQYVYKSVSWIFRATRIRCHALSGLPYQLYKGKRIVAESDKPESNQPFSNTDLEWLLWRTEAARCMFGASFWLKRPANEELQWLNPNPRYMEVLTGPSGIIGFQQKNTTNDRTYRPDQIVYMPTWNPDDDLKPGVACAQVALDDAMLAVYTTTMASGKFEHGALLDIILTTDQPSPPPEEVERIRGMIETIHQGVKKWFKTLILGRGLKPTVIGQRMNELALPELEDQTRERIAAAYGMSVTYLEGGAASRATAQEETLKFVTGTLIPDARIIQSSMNRQLWEPLGYRWEYQFNKIEAMQQNEAMKGQEYARLLFQLGKQYEANILTRERAVYIGEQLWDQIGIPIPENMPDKEPEPPKQEPEPVQAPLEGQPGIQPEGDDLRTWRRRSLKRFKEGGDFRGPFESKVLSQETKDVVALSLEMAETAEDIRGAFDPPFAKAVRETADGQRDPDAENKDRDEARLTRLLTRFFREQLARIMRKLGRKPDINKVDYAFWEKERAGLMHVLGPNLERMAATAAETMYENNPVTGQKQDISLAFDWGLIADAAATWAELYVGQLITQIDGTTQRGVRQKVNQFVTTPGMTIGDLSDNLGKWFGPTRASMIAVTETTRAYAEGQRVFADRAKGAGFNVVAVWQTSYDELVCDVCGPNHGKPQTEGWTVDWFPAHPRCRCWPTHEWLGML